MGIKNVLLCICILKNKQATPPPSGAAQQGGGAAQQPQPPHERRLEINLLKASSHSSSCIEIQTTASGGRGGVSELGAGILRPIKILNNIHVELDGSRQVGEADKKYLLDGISAKSTNTGPAMMMSCTDKIPRFGTHHSVGIAMLGVRY